MNYILASALLFTCFHLWGCGKNDLPDYNRLGSLRILAMKADTPETSVGSTVTINPLVSDIQGGTRTISYVAEGCTDPGVGYGATPSCATATDRTALGTGSFNMSPSNFTASVATISVTIPSSVFTNRTALEQYNGVAYLVIYTFSVPGETITAFKRIFVSTRTIKNNNPTLQDITVDEASLTSLPASYVSVKPKISGSSLESYSVLTANGDTQTQPETLTTTWFISEGSFDRTRTDGFDTNGFSPGERSANHSVVIVLVTRDNRGGEDFLIRSF